MKNEYDEHTISLVWNNVCSFSKNPNESIEIFLENTIMMVTRLDNLSQESASNLIFYVACCTCANIAIYMFNNNMYTKKTFTTFYNNLTPLHNAIIGKNIELIKCFAENLEYFNELLFLKKENYTISFFTISNNEKGSDILECMTNSTYTSEETFKHCPYSLENNNIFHLFVMSSEYHLAIRLLKSEKCTYDVIKNKNKFYFMKHPVMFIPILESGKLPLDFFKNSTCVFYSNDQNINAFINSKYCNDQIVEAYLANALKCKNTPYARFVPVLLTHFKYLHLSKKYNIDYFINSENKQKVVVERCVSNLLDENEELKQENEKLKIENELLEKNNQILKARYELLLSKYNISETQI